MGARCAEVMRMMKVLKMSLLLGLGFCLNAGAEPLVRGDRPVEELPGLELDDAATAEERLIREVLGIEAEGALVAPGEDVELGLMKRFEEVGKRLRDREAGREAREQAAADLAGLFAEEREVEGVAGRWLLGVRVGPENELKVSGVMAGSPAEKAGLQVGDVLLTVNGIMLRDMPMLQELVQLVRDQQVVLTYTRGEEKRRAKLAAVQQEDLRALREREEDQEEARKERARQEELRMIRKELRELMERVEKLGE